MLATSTSAMAYDFEVDGIRYDITSFTEFTVTASSVSDKTLETIAFPKEVSFSGKNLSVTTIGDSILTNDTIVKRIIIEEGIKHIGNHCFDGCTALTAISIPEGTLTIGYGAFKGCIKLENLDLPNSITEIDSYAFKDCVSLQKLDLSSTSIQEVPSYLCENCIGLLKIELSSFISTISAYAFSGCSSLSQIEIPESVTDLGSYAFQNCSSLKEVIVPNSVTSLSGSFLSGCTNVKKLILGSGITSLEDTNPIEDCDSLEQLIIADSASPLDFEGGLSFFSNNSINYVYLGRNTTNAGFGSSNIRTFIVGPQVTSLPNFFLENCASLDSLEIKGNIEEIGSYALAGLTQLQSISIPHSVKKIGYRAFENCTSLNKISIGKRCEEIGDNAFDGCLALQEIDLFSVKPPVYNTDFDNQLYISCALNIPSGCAETYKTASPWNKFWNMAEQASLFIEFTIDSIDYELTNEKEVKVLNCKRKEYSWSGNKYSYKSYIIIPDTVTYDSIKYTVTAIADKAFADLCSLDSISIPGSCTSIGNEVFQNCEDLKYIIFEKGASPLTLGHGKYIEGNIVHSFPNPTTVEEARTGIYYSLYKGLFEGLPIKKLIINRDISLSTYFIREKGTPTTEYPIIYNEITFNPPFANLDDLEYLEIGEDVSSICQNTIQIVQYGEQRIIEYTNFGGCNDIDTVVAKNPIAPIGGGFTSNVYNNATLILPNGGDNSYKNDEYWGNFKNIGATDIPGLRQNESMHIYASDGKLKFKGFNGQERVTIYSASGILIFSGFINGIPQLSSGLYIIKVAETGLTCKIFI